jgi:signal transduction histidine kinase
VNAAGLRTLLLARVYLVAGLLATGLYFVLPWNSFPQELLYDAIGACSAIVVVLGARINKPRQMLSWYLFGAGLLAFSIGDVVFNLYAEVWHRDPPVPSVADIFYLAGYPFLAAGLIALVLQVRRRDRRFGLLDAALLTVSFALCQWVFVMRGVAEGSGSSMERAVALSYPGMDVVLLAALVFFALTPAWRTAAYRYLALSLVGMLFADELYGLSPGSYAGASWLDAFWLLSYILWAVAALDPSMRALSEPASSSAPGLTRSRLLVLGAALATAPSVLLAERVVGRPVDADAVAVGAALLSGLVLARLGGMVRALDRLHEGERLARAEAESAHRLLADQNEQLREADRLKDEFVALISHDLRTPLTSITGYVELALEDDLSDEVRGFLDVVSRNTERLLALVNDLLFVARLQTGEMSLEPAEVDLDDVVRDGVRSLEPRASAKRVTLTCEVEEVPRTKVDRGRILQVVDNLLSNAVKFTPAGGAVHVSLRRDAERLVLEVADTGIGIAPQDQRRLFERFFRAENAVERHVPGTGLGLYISRAIAEAHGGTLTVRSELGRGSSFRLELPLAVVAVSEAAHGLDRHGVGGVRVELAP